MRSTTVRDVRAAVADEARRAADPFELERAVAAQLSRVSGFDIWCGLTLDPGTGHATDGYHAQGLPEHHLPTLAEIEQAPESDFLTLRVLARRDVSVGTLSAATDGDLGRSRRFLEVLQPSGVRHELRVVLRTADRRPWGAMVFMRGTDAADFGPADVALLDGLGRTVADGIRRSVLNGRRTSPDADAPGLLLCSVDETVVVDHASETGRAWLDEVDDGSEDSLPYALTALAHAAARRDGPARVRIRTRAGRWLTAHAELLGAGTVSVILEPTRPLEVAELLADAYRLTAREREVAALVGRGLSNQQIGEQLFLSRYTVQDHLKALFAKTGARNRSELSAALYPELGGRDS